MAQHSRLQPRQPVAAAGAAEGDRIVVGHQLAAAAGEDRRSVDRACSLLLAIAGGRTPAREGGSRRCCAGSRCCRFRQTERLIAMPANLIAEDKGEGNGVCKIDEEGSRLSGRVQDCTEPPGFSTTNVVLVLQFAS